MRSQNSPFAVSDCPRAPRCRTGQEHLTETGGNALGCITMSGDLAEFSFDGPQTNPDGITVGSDNLVWFTHYAGNALGAVLLPE